MAAWGVELNTVVYEMHEVYGLTGDEIALIEDRA